MKWFDLDEKGYTYSQCGKYRICTDMYHGKFIWVLEVKPFGEAKTCFYGTKKQCREQADVIEQEQSEAL